MTSATVYLVGAGPGDVGLVSVRALELIKRADVIVHDYLANSELLSHAPKGAKLMDVGKKGYEKHLTQEEINELLVKEAKKFECADMGGTRPATIVRLKGGDPFVFGRGGEEAIALKRAGVPFEIVPGITSGIAAPAYAGIPVTHRKVASSVTFITGNEDPTRNTSSIDWHALAALAMRGNTLCFYMGMKNLELITDELVKHGVSQALPVAVVHKGTLPEQKTLVSDLRHVVQDARQAAICAPAVIVVGDVVGLSCDISWLDSKPLHGKSIVVTRARSQASVLAERLSELGARVHEVPTIRIEAPTSFDALDEAIGKLETFRWVVFTSVNGVDAFFSRLAAFGKDARALGSSKVAAIGPATAKRLSAHGINADCIPGVYRAEAVFDAMVRASDSMDGATVLIARAEQAREVLPKLLEEAGARVFVASAYKTVPAEEGQAKRLADLLENHDVDAITFTSSSTVDNLCAMLGSRMRELLKGVDLCSIGPITSDTLAKHGLHASVQADEYTIDGLVEAMCKRVQHGQAR